MVVSPKHANFLINLDNATAYDALALVKHLQDTVRERCGVELHPEFKWIGEPHERD